jgi:hypothetical protein
MTTKGFGMVLAAAVALLAAAPRQAFADKGGKHHGRKGYFTTTIDHKHRGLPPGLAKRESLPPGLARQLHERGRLPPGLQKRLTPVPAGWGRTYPTWSRYHARYFAGRDLVIVDTRTHRVVSIIRDAR